MDRNDVVYKAGLAIAAERYDEAMKEIKRVAYLDVELNVAEMNVIAAAFKNATDQRRNSWRELSSAKRKEESKGNQENVELVEGYMRKVEMELTDICIDFQSVLVHHVVPYCSSQEDRVFCFKMLADSYRYCAELKNGEERDTLAQRALEKYELAAQIAAKELNVTDPTRLGLALNYSVLFYEIYNSHETAREIAQKALDEAMLELGTAPLLGGEEEEKSERILEIIKDNLSIWAAIEAEQHAVNIQRAGGDDGAEEGDDGAEGGDDGAKGGDDGAEGGVLGVEP